MPFENQYPGDRSSRSLVMRRGERRPPEAGKMRAGQVAALAPRAYRQTHRPLIQDPPGNADETLRTSSDTWWRGIPAGVSGLLVKTAGGIAACGEFALSRLMLAAVSWMFAQALEGCAAYAAAMYPIPVDRDEPLDRRDTAAGGPLTRRAASDRLGSPTSGPGGISPCMKAAIRGNAPVLHPVLSSAVALEAEYVARTQVPATVAPGWMASIRSVPAGFRSRMRRWRDRHSAITEMRSLDDRSLRDIGISRCDIEYVVRRGDRHE